MDFSEGGFATRARQVDLGALFFLLFVGAGAFAVGTLLAGHPVLALGGIMAAAMGLAFLISPPAGLFLLVGSIPFELSAVPSAGGLIAYSGVKLLGLTVLAAWLARWVIHGDYPLRANRQQALFVLFLGCLILSTFVARNLVGALDALLRWAQLSILYLLAQVLVDRRDRLQGVFWAILLTMGVSAVWGAYQGLHQGFRATGFTDDPNEFCLYLNAALFLGLGLAFSMDRGPGRRAALALTWGAIAAIVLGIILTGSRSGFVTLAASGVLWAFLQPRKTLGALVLIGAAGAISVLAPSYYWERIQTLSRPTADSSLRGRLYEFQAGVRMIERNPILGVGTGNFESNYILYSRDPRREPRLAHNLYLQIGGENGLVGLTALLLLAGYTVVRLWRLEAGLRAADPGGLRFLTFGLLLAVVSFLIGSLFLSSQFSKYFPLLIGLLPAAERLAAAAAERPGELPVSS